jgi:Nickel responsive protein SCO4226-like
MPLYMIEREFKDKLELPENAKDEIRAVNSRLGINWVETMLRDDGKKTYCLYESPTSEKIREQASILGIPADVIVEVSRVQPVDEQDRA